jgi:WD40 repeat protein
LISAGKDGYLRFWDRAANYLKKLEIPAHNFGIYQIDFFNDDKNFISISRDKSIKLWDCDNWKVLQKIERKHGGHSHAVNAFWKKSESEFITVSDDKRINNWELIVSKI